MPTPSRIVLASSLGALALGSVIAFAIARRPSAPEPVPVPLAVEPVPEPPPLTETVTTAQAGDSLGAMVTRANARALLAALNEAVGAKAVRPGDRLRVWSGEAGIARAAWEAGARGTIDLLPEGSGFRAVPRTCATETARALVSVTIAHSLWAAFQDAGEDPALAVRASDVLAYELDFYRDLREGDRFDLLVDRPTCEGKPAGEGELLAVRYTHDGAARTFLRYDHGGETGWYDPDGRSVKRAFLKQPLPLVRITSKFGKRMHPVLGYVKQHEGIDYGAPTGTPVWAVGDGVVTWAGPKGPNGNLVSVRHANGFFSHYAHLSRIGAGVKVGARVTQKQVVGYVGQTGRATGPHLHFALSKNGAFLNPLGLKFPAGEPIPAREHAAFATAIQPLLERLDRRMVAARDP